MGDFTAGQNREILFPRFGLNEAGGDVFDGLVDGAGVGNFDVNLLDLEIGEGGGVSGVYEHGMIKIDVIEIDGIVGGIKDADNHEFLI